MPPRQRRGQHLRNAASPHRSKISIVAVLFCSQMGTLLFEITIIILFFFSLSKLSTYIQPIRSATDVLFLPPNQSAGDRQPLPLHCLRSRPVDRAFTQALLQSPSLQDFSVVSSLFAIAKNGHGDYRRGCLGSNCHQRRRLGRSQIATTTPLHVWAEPACLSGNHVAAMLWGVVRLSRSGRGQY